MAYRWGLHSQKLQRDAAAKSAVENRKRDFLSVMQAWRVEIDRWHHVVGGFERRPMVFLDGISGFRANVEMIRRDFTKDRRDRLDELVAIVPKCNAHDIEKVLKALDAVVAYVDAE